MKQKLLIIISALLLTALSLTGCDILFLPPTADNNNPSADQGNPNEPSGPADEEPDEDNEQTCDHQFGEWQTVKKPANGVNGRQERVCTLCGKTESRSISKEHNTDSDKYKDYDALLITELSYQTEGITVLSICERSTYTLKVIAKNENDKLIEYLELGYSIFDDNDSLRASNHATIQNVAPGESFVLSFNIDSKTAKLRIGDANVRTSDKNYSEPETINVNGYTYNALPYTTNGITITGFSVNKSLYTATVLCKNETGEAIEYASIPVYFYDESGVRIASSLVNLSSTAPDGAASDDFGIMTNAVKYIFGEATYRIDEDYVDDQIETEVNSFGIKTNKLPYTVDGITILEMVAKSEFYATFIIRNDGDKVIEKSSSIVFETFGADEVTLENKYVSPQHMNPGESCYIDVRINDKVKSIIYSDIILREGDRFDYGETTTIEGITTNALPYLSNGLEIVSITFGADSYAKVTVKNTTDVPMSNNSYFPCKILDSKNIITNSGYLYLTHLDPGQSCELSVYLANDPTKLLFGEAVFNEGELYPNSELMSFEGLNITSAPYTSNGVTAVSYEKKYDTCISVTFRNDTDEQLGGNPIITYKCLNSEGVVVKEGEIYLNRTFPGETEQRNLIYTEDTVTIILGVYTSY